MDTRKDLCGGIDGIRVGFRGIEIGEEREGGGRKRAKVSTRATGKIRSKLVFPRRADAVENENKAL